jgi:hypothetical protein
MAFPAATSGRARRFHFLLRVTYGGTDYRFATDALNVPSASGTVAHAAGLSVGNYSETFQFLSQNIDRQSVSVSVLWRGIAAQIAEGYRLDTARGELAVWVEGTNYEDRRVLVVGQCMEPSYGADSDPVAFSIEAPPWGDQGKWPDLYRFDPDDTPSTVPTSLGDLAVEPDARSTSRTSTTVIGNPGNLDRKKRTAVESEDISANVDLWRSTVPGAVTGLSIGVTTGATKFPGLLMLCGHATQAGAYGSLSQDIETDDTPLVNLYDGDGQWLTTTIPFHYQFAGRTVTACPIYEIVATGLGSTMLTKSLGDISTIDSFGFTFTSGHSDFDTFYGLIDGEQDGPLRKVHELITLTLSRSSIPVDWPRLYSALSSVPNFDVEGYVNEEVSVWEFVSRELLPLMPVSLRNGPNGLYLLVADFSSTVDDTIGTLYAGRDCFRESGVQYEKRLADLSGKIEVECGSNMGQPALTVTADFQSMVQGQRAKLAKRSAYPSRLFSKIRQTSIDGNEKTIIRAPWLAGQAGGHYVANMRLAARAAQLRTITYRLAPEYVELEAGDLVRIVDAEVSIDGPAYLSTLTIGDGVVLGTFTIYDPIMR